MQAGRQRYNLRLVQKGKNIESIRRLGIESLDRRLRELDLLLFQRTTIREERRCTRQILVAGPVRTILEDSSCEPSSSDALLCLRDRQSRG